LAPLRELAEELSVQNNVLCCNREYLAGPVIIVQLYTSVNWTVPNKENLGVFAKLFGSI
jgi:hypothetical protein